MRTREEQIADLENILGEEGTFSFVDDLDAATKHILEAERRAEERVRAQIARDSERLDWLADHQCSFLNKGLEDPPLRIINDCMGDEMASSYDLREAIDAAREVG